MPLTGRDSTGKIGELKIALTGALGRLRPGQNGVQHQAGRGEDSSSQLNGVEITEDDEGLGSNGERQHSPHARLPNGVLNIKIDDTHPNSIIGNSQTPSSGTAAAAASAEVIAEGMDRSTYYSTEEDIMENQQQVPPIAIENGQNSNDAHHGARPRTTSPPLPPRPKRGKQRTSGGGSAAGGDTRSADVSPHDASRPSTSAGAAGASSTGNNPTNKSSKNRDTIGSTGPQSARSGNQPAEREELPPGWGNIFFFFFFKIQFESLIQCLKI